MGNTQSNNNSNEKSSAVPIRVSEISASNGETFSTPPSSPPNSRTDHHHHPDGDSTSFLQRPPSASTLLRPRETIPVTITYLSRDAQHIHPPKPIVINQQPIPIVREPYTPPPTERSYKNSARIVHAFGVGGLAPLAPLAKGEDSKKRTIPIMIGWTGGGRTVYITGTFNNWKQKIRMFKSNADFSTVIDMPPGTHRLKFVVDDEWKCSEDLPVASDADGNLVNFLEVEDEDGRHQNDGLDSLAGDEAPPPLSPLSESPESTYASEIPSYLTRPSTPPASGPSSSKTPAASNNSSSSGNTNSNISSSSSNSGNAAAAVTENGPSPDALPTEPPPGLPPHLERVLLNSGNMEHEDASILPLPDHVTLNHLYALSIRDGVMAVATTARYRRKYVTILLYKPTMV
ncbi:hypothetical protein SmJEL517_g03967 [Synchytrium microbalum]|uniref:Association with the SNF1 complex (ASC) domain-containing protein n=1 Tax=Synchytrium microbalum TaxID=1806994 RepID=A0A507C692_9FUNG|nr:uncharacterized protein SmJEL517_g03967 [Synchytrium microbalum]TPX32995.1 hypothetical protein SmJEL517_g03967 [Synchytrium microbalum]